MWNPFLARRPWAQYVTAFRDHLNFWAVWWPGDYFEVGDFGVLERGCFKRRGTLKNYFKIDRKKDVLEKKTQELLQLGIFRMQSAAAGVGANAEPVGASCMADLDVSGSNGVFFRATGISKAFLISPSKLERQILDAVYNGSFEWEADYLFVHEVVSAESFVALSTRLGNGTVQVRGTFDALNALDLGQAKVSAGLDASSDFALQIFGQSGSVALGLSTVDLTSCRVEDRFTAGEASVVRLHPVLPQSVRWYEEE